MSPPDDLDPGHHDEFRKIVEQLGSLASVANVDMVARLARCRAEERDLATAIGGEGLLVNGRKHPLLPALDKVRQRISKLEIGLGLDLNARRRILGRPIRPGDDPAEGEQAFLMRMLLTYDVTDTPPPEDVARLGATAAAKRKSKPARRPRSRH